MAQDSKIEWLRPMRPDGTLMPGHTANLWWGCTEVHAGCDNCYAKAWAKRYQPTGLWGNDTPRMRIEGVWNDLAKYQRQAAALGEIHRVFVGSMMDIGERNMPVIRRDGTAIRDGHGNQFGTHPIRTMFFNNVVPVSPNLLFLFLSKRASNYPHIIPDAWHDEPPTNVMFGTSIVDDKSLRTLLPQLLRVNGRRFLSLEPQLENIPEIDLTGIHWVIQGGESGPKKRPFNTDWARRMRDICKEQNVPYFFKQIDKIQPIPDDLQIRQFPVTVKQIRVGYELETMDPNRKIVGVLLANDLDHAIKLICDNIAAHRQVGKDVTGVFEHTLL